MSSVQAVIGLSKMGQELKKVIDRIAEEGFIKIAICLSSLNICIEFYEKLLPKFRRYKNGSYSELGRVIYFISSSCQCSFWRCASSC